MSIVAIPFAVSLEKVKNVFGSKDPQLLENIKTANLYKHYADPDFGNPQYKYDMDEMLEDIIFNYDPSKKGKSSRGFLGMFQSRQYSGLKPRMGYAYGYTLLVICDYLGTHLMRGSDGFYAGRDWNTACDILRKNGLKTDIDQIFGSHSVFDIPPIDDFPCINCFSVEEIVDIHVVSKTIEIDEEAADNIDFDEVQFTLKSIHECTKTCLDAGLDLITFAH
ncbi:hypothetical protein [Chitinophaga sp. HK235]|uniref:DUF7691 family protein n=1 Tax=Chitinophaga sp. HK235 TaxID=2952571 RepID=UPI001BABD684|nr:hypothetical protein [Chitinophaga sp. HK235]